jgi:outer membrane protein TolC
MAIYQYESGLIGYSSLLDTQQSHDDAQRAQVKLDYERKIAEANYFHSLGF